MNIYIKSQEMSKRYYITESQMKRVITHIKEDQNKQEVLEEGWKEVALGAAMLLGATFGGNQAIAQKANDAVNKTEILTQIKSTLEDEEGKAELAKFLKMTPEQLDIYLSKNADKVENDFEMAAKKKKLNLSLHIKDIKNQRGGITSKLKQGYAVSDIVIHRDTIMEPNDVVYVQDTIDIAYSNSEMFVTGKYQLTPEVMNDINQTIESLNSIGGKIVKVNVEASTDKEPIRIGNDQLAKNRANSVVQVLQSLGVDAEMSVTTLPDQGPDVYSGGMSSEERQQAREHTSEYRYVRISFVVVVAEKVVQPEPLYKVNERVEVKLVKTGVYKKGKPKKFKYKKQKTNYKGKCVKAKKYKGPKLDCSFGQ
jgi:flagellar motor protein MotB